MFHKYNVFGWQVSPTDQCYICENWRYTLFFYDRRKHVKNKTYEAMTRWVMELVNKVYGTDFKRRRPPVMTAPTLIPYDGSIQMSNMLEYAARLNRHICHILEQT